LKQIRTKAIVLSTLKYGDAGLIVHCYTQALGRQSYLLRGVLKSKRGLVKKAYFQPLTQLDLLASQARKSSLNALKEARPFFVYQSIHSDFTKQSLTFFLAEMLSGVLREEVPNEPLFLYIEAALQWLDLHENVANFHLVFLINLTKYLGFYPDDTFIEKPYFHMIDGQFSDKPIQKNGLFGKQLSLFKLILGTNFDAMQTLSLNVSNRRDLLGTVIRYYELHFSGFREPKSLQILKELFDS
jgi:DNA repair protein RecO (recombination protein O)